MTRARCLRFILFIATIAAGCRVDQKKEVERYQTVLRANLLNNEQPFTAGQPLTLRQALDLANRQNERLSIEGENYLQALIDRRGAAAAFMPTVTLAPTFTARQNVAAAQGNSISAQDTAFDVPARGQFNAFNGFSDVARLRSTAQTAVERRNLLLDVQEGVLLDTAGVYYNVLRAERSVEVLQNSLAVQEARVRDITGRQRAGLARPLDVAQTEAQASATRVALINAINDVRNGRATLALLTAAAVVDNSLADRFEVPATLATLAELQQLAAEHRRDLAAARAGALAARQEVEVAFGQYYPSLTLNANLFLYRESFPDERRWDALLQANLPIFAAGLIHADVREAWSRFRQAAMIESLVARQVLQDVLLSYQNFAANDDRINELQVQVTAAEQAFNQADQSYVAGLATNLERVTAQDQLLSAQLQLTSARFDRTLSFLVLARAAGSLRRHLELTPATLPTPPTTLPAN